MKCSMLHFVAGVGVGGVVGVGVVVAVVVVSSS